MNQTPALLGGKPAVTDDHAAHLRWPLLENDDFEMVKKVMQDGNISTHPIRLELEEVYKKEFGRTHALSHCNGTSALMAAFFAINLKPGDEVLVTSATWWASVLPALWLGAIPVFCENEESQLGICTNDMAAKVTAKTRAIVVVHLWGMPSKMDEINAFAKKHKLFVIEDASHAHGAVWNGTKCGKFGDISVFSLQGDKLAPAGEGGIFMTDNYDLWERAVLFGDVTRIYHLETESRALAATSFGIKTRMAPVSAAIGISQLKKLAEHNSMRNKNIEYVSQALEQMGFETYLGDKNIQRTYFEFLIRWKQPHPKGVGRLIEALQAEGTKTDNPRYPLLHNQPFFTMGLWQQVARLPEGIVKPDYSKTTLPRTEKTNNEMLRLPHFSTAKKEFLDTYISAFEKVMSNIEAIYK